ncbi:PINX1 inhibitor, partial [Polypterus senegalus]|nr:PINX1 inhibitor [Polypterus senegalus]
MAMLAEPRRKQKWSVDPRNSSWSKDDSKFGQKMLEKMGWTKGKGLGVNEQGGTEHVKVQVKNNTLGLGTSNNYEDNWIAHQDDFNQLLADLNSCHSQNETEDSPKTESFSLEQKSKSSRKRVHYMKFTKGKDLSNRSETDLDCIFGKRKKKNNEQNAESSGSESQSREDNVKGTTSSVNSCSDSEETPNTVTSTLTVQEYFAQQMSRLKKTRREEPPDATSCNPTTHPPPSTPEEGPSKPRKKKKKQSKEEVEEQKYESGVLEKDLQTEENGVCIRKKSRKSKRRASDGEHNDGAAEGQNEGGGSCHNTMQETLRETKKKKKLKKDKKKKEEKS